MYYEGLINEILELIYVQNFQLPYLDSQPYPPDMYTCNNEDPKARNFDTERERKRNLSREGPERGLYTGFVRGSVSQSQIIVGGPALRHLGYPGRNVTARDSVITY